MAIELTLTPSEVITALKACLSNGNVIMCIQGESGIGKSDCVAQACDELGRNLNATLRLSQTDAPDIRGMPDVMHANGTMRWIPADWFPTDPDSDDVIFIDELGQGLHTTQAAMMQFMLERRIGGNELPPGVGIVAATNRVQDRAGVHRLLAPMSRRLTHVTMVPSVRDWCTWAISPRGQAKGVDMRVIALIRFKQDLLHAFDKNQDVDPNPRAWERVSQIINMNLPPKTEHVLIAGTVGEGAATVATAFFKVCTKLPNIDHVLARPKDAPVPDELDVRCAVATGIAMAATVHNMDSVVTYAGRLDKDLEIFSVTSAVTKDPSLASTHAYTRWAIENQGYTS